ncbi:Uncharacterised protein [Orientia tsutsugamushi]|uniref:hypothetical protein n=1 Tax=Orientia tsutsugamushi TaxID=784 RepID=UPI0005F9030D|nr:hypothetical protein [Orientia tsutsugamushi]KJV75827.1 hypothetical protein OTSTA763_0189 [Orientia tsutsugamushi str. TA763]SPP24129.1 Uncharacterised protein [Orientia tsutsugamushi]
MPRTVSESLEDKEEQLVIKIVELEQALKDLEKPLDKYIKKHGLTEQSKNLLDGLTSSQEELEKLKLNNDPTNTEPIWTSLIKALTKFISTIKQWITGEPDQSISNSMNKISSFIEEAEKIVQEDPSILQSVCNKLKKLYSSTISSDTPEKGIGGTTTTSPEEPAHASFKGGAAGFAALAEQLAEKYGHSSTREEEDSSKSKHKKSLLASSENLASSSAAFLETARQLSSNLNPSATPKTTPTTKSKKDGYSK